MNINLKCIPYINTFGSEKYKKFLSMPFDEKFIANTTDKEAILFNGWMVRDRGNYKVYTHDTNTRYMLEIYPVGYNIISPAGTRHIPVHPQNLDQFITDCNRCGLDLHWHEKILYVHSYHEILEPKAIEEYHTFLLEKLGKTD